MEQASSPGGMTTSESFAGGFWASPHANALFYQDFASARRHWNPEVNGLHTHNPEAQAGVAFADGRPPIVLHRRDRPAKTAKAIARYSRRDARMFESLLKRAQPLANFAGESPYRQLDEARFSRQLSLTTDCFGGLGIDQAACLGTAVGLIDGLFETPELRLLLYHMGDELGVPITSAGGALAFLSQVVPSLGRWRIPQGTMRALSDSLRETAMRAGAQLLVDARVSGVRVTDQRCDGVVLENGEVILARRAVAFATSLSAGLALMGPDCANEDQTRLAILHQSPQGRFARATFCLDRPYRYHSAKYDEDINRCLHTLIGFDTPGEYLRDLEGLERGVPPAPAGALRVSSHWDRTLAPPGGHVATLDVSFPPQGAFDAESWYQIEEGFLEAFFDTWRGHLIDFDGLLHDRPIFQFADTYDRRLPLSQGEDQYRAATPGVYFAGAGVFPGGGVHGGCAINAFRVIASDLQ